MGAAIRRAEGIVVEARSGECVAGELRRDAGASWIRAEASRWQCVAHRVRSVEAPSTPCEQLLSAQLLLSSAEP